MEKGASRRGIWALSEPQAQGSILVRSRHITLMVDLLRPIEYSPPPSGLVHHEPRTELDGHTW